MKPGVRVVRGPDWKFGNQDGGEGNVGTVVYVPKSGSSDPKVTVIWDSGRELRYRAGEEGKYDLRVFDLGPIGVVHSTIVCDGCREHPVVGLRWKCAVCRDFDLCTNCYMNQKHDVSHSFLRIDTEGSIAFTVASRNHFKPRGIFGVFSTAEVVRGPHWKWKNDDGGEGEVGRVESLKTWPQSSYRGGVSVTWKVTKKKETYRLGGEGCVDLVYTQSARLGNYYMEHLPLVDVVSPGQIRLKSSDKIRVNLDLQGFKALQDNAVYGNWSDGMVQCTKELGTIVNILFSGKTIRAQYEDGHVWTMNRAAVTRVHSFSLNEAVRILEDFNAVRDLQEGHGGWNDDMKEALGKVGRIMKIDKDGDLRVMVGSQRWIFNPTCCSPVEDLSSSQLVPRLADGDLEKEELDDAEEMARDMDQVAGAIANLFVALLRGVPGSDPGETSLVEAAAKGDLAKVKSLVQRDPAKVDMTVENKTALQLASYEGHKEIVTFLLDKRASIDLEDEEGDTALHYSAFGEEDQTMKILLDRGAKKDVGNKKGLTSLHIAVGKASLPCVQLLVGKGASVTIQDCTGDTAMHDSIIQKNSQPQIAEAVLGARNCDYRQANKKGFNVLHWAALKDNRRAVELVLQKNAGMVNDKMAEGFTAMHIAAANDHIEVASILIQKAKADVNPVDNNGRSPLHIAVSQSHKRITELLLAAECNVNLPDKDGNTPLHVAQMQRALPDQMARLLGVRGSRSDVGIQITCLLLEARAKLEVKNKKGHTPLDLCPDDTTKEFLQRLSKQALSNSLQRTQKGVITPSHWDPMDKKVLVVRVLLHPTEGSSIQQKEFQSVEKKFKQSLPQAKIFKMERIQNKYLWEHYYLQRHKFECEYGPGCGNELDLYHGTTPDLVDVICDQNLDPRLSGERVGAIFGKGAYLATHAKYSDGYSEPDDKTRHKYMFIMKVLAGKICRGDPDFKRPPPINDRDPKSKLFDCCVDDTKHPRIYCLFDRNQIYPEYIIEYK